MTDSFHIHRFIRLAEEGNTTECLALAEKTKRSGSGESSEPGFDINAKDDEGWTALHKAVQNGHKSIVLKLIDLGVSVHAVDGAGVTPLHMASRGGHVPTMKALLGSQADLCCLLGDMPAFAKRHPVDFIEALLASGKTEQALGATLSRSSFSSGH